jgi:hypothetical protein
VADKEVEDDIVLVNVGNKEELTVFDGVTVKVAHTDGDTVTDTDPEKVCETVVVNEFEPVAEIDDDVDGLTETVNEARVDGDDVADEKFDDEIVVVAETEVLFVTDNEFVFELVVDIDTDGLVEDEEKFEGETVADKEPESVDDKVEETVFDGVEDVDEHSDDEAVTVVEPE